MTLFFNNMHNTIKEDKYYEKNSINYWWGKRDW